LILWPRSDLDESLPDFPGFRVSHGSCSVGYDDEGSKRVNILIAAGHLISISVFVVCNVCLLFIVCNLVAEAVLRVVIKGLLKSPRLDLVDINRRCNTKPGLRGSQAHS